jgi:hypothetical protein
MNAPPPSDRLAEIAEIARIACLMPGIARVAAMAGEPLSLIELDAGAGFNLLCDHYGYDYGRAGDLGPDEPLLSFECDAQGSKLPPLPAGMPRIGARIGIDPEPVDLGDAEQRRRLEAAIAPEMRERRESLAQAIEIALHHRPRLLKGAALPQLPGLLQEIGGPLCLFHCMTLHRWTPDERDALHHCLTQASADRVIHRLGLEMEGEECCLDHFVYDRGASSTRRLARCQAHGTWIRWVG